MQAMNEQHYVSLLPFLADWADGDRARFVAGMAELQAWRFQSTQIDNLIGVLIIDAEGHDVRVIQKDECHKRAVEWEFSEPELDAIASRGRPGALDVLLMCGTVRVVFCMPVQLIPLPKPGSENN